MYTVWSYLFMLSLAVFHGVHDIDTAFAWDAARANQYMIILSLVYFFVSDPRRYISNTRILFKDTLPFVKDNDFSLMLVDALIHGTPTLFLGLTVPRPSAYLAAACAYIVWFTNMRPLLHSIYTPTYTNEEMNRAMWFSVISVGVAVVAFDKQTASGGEHAQMAPTSRTDGHLVDI
jgi:hypothetical protein